MCVFGMTLAKDWATKCGYIFCVTFPSIIVRREIVRKRKKIEPDIAYSHLFWLVCHLTQSAHAKYKKKTHTAIIKINNGKSVKEVLKALKNQQNKKIPFPCVFFSTFSFLFCSFLEMCRLICLRLRLLNFFFPRSFVSHSLTQHWILSTQHVKKKKLISLVLYLATCVFDILKVAKWNDQTEKKFFSYRQAILICWNRSAET